MRYRAVSSAWPLDASLVSTRLQFKTKYKRINISKCKGTRRDSRSCDLLNQAVASLIPVDIVERRRLQLVCTNS